MTHQLRRILLRRILPALALLAAGALPVTAQSCKKEDFAGAVDQAGGALRKFNLENQPKLNVKLEALRAKKGWKKTDSEDKALEYLQDGRISELDAQSNELLTKIDTLGRTEDGKAVDCSKLAELKSAGAELLTVMKAKAAYTQEKIDLELEGHGKDAKPAVPAGTAGDVKIISKAPAAEPKQDTKPVEVKPIDPKAAETRGAERKRDEPKRDEPRREAPREVARAAPPATQPLPPSAGAGPAGTRGERLPDVSPQRAGPGAPSSSGWETSSEQAMAQDPGDLGEPGVPYGPPDGAYVEDDGYTIDEIREVTRGFFGTISTNLASVIEYAFAKSGRPTAYILGTEGGGAFLAGLRYGNGTLYRRSGGTETTKVYWHGPSLGYDVGAEGSRTLFLIYKMHEPDQLYRSFTGIDGSAYVVGGVGLTLLKGGPVLMAPIRSGVGLRLGANLGYVRFTSQPTWNPF